MKIYWSASSTPELAGLPREEATKAWQACYLKGYKHWQTWLGFCIWILCTVLGRAIGEQFSHQIFIIGSRIACVAGGWLIFEHIYIRQVRPYLRQYIDQHYRE